MADLQPLSIEKALPSARSSSRWGVMDQVICLLVFMSAAAILIMMLDYHRLDGTLGLWPAWDQPEFFQPSPSEALRVPRTVVRGAVEKGAVCLDGTAPSYHIHKGRGFGRNNWLVHLEGGGWCASNSSCLDRSKTRLGSSTSMEETVIFGGILSDSPTKNPDFYNWNRVKVRYCDGGSLSGERDAPIQIKDSNTNIEKVVYFRGQRIWRAILADLMSKGMIKAKKALLSGCSAGGLASILHCDDFQSQLPKTAVVKCMSDAGFFLDVKDVKGNPTIQSFYKDVVSVHGISASLPQSCRSVRDAGQCFFPQYLLKTIKTPLFILNPAYDTWQIDHILVPVTGDPSGSWEYCKDNPASCSHDELKILQGFRVKLLEAIGTVEGSTDGGLFVNSCFIHCQSEWDQTWHGAHAPRVKGRTIAETVGDWYYHRRPAKDVDCAYPCNPSCFNNNFRTSSPVH